MSAVVVPARPETRSAGMLLAAGVLWGTGGLAGSLLASLAALHPLSVATYRLLLGGVLTAGLLAATGGLRGLTRTPEAVRRILVAGSLLAVFQASYFISVILTSVSVATMVTIGSVPVFVAVASAVAERRRPANSAIVSIVAALLGLLLLTWSPEGAGDQGHLLAGLLVALLSGGGFAALTLLTRQPVAGLDPLHTTALGCLAGGVLLLPFAWWLGMGLPFDAEAMALALYLGAVPTALAYTAFFRGLRGAHPVLAALAALLEPLTAALLAAVLLDERLGVTGWSGAGLLAVALAVSYWRPRR